MENQDNSINKKMKKAPLLALFIFLLALSIYSFVSIDYSLQSSQGRAFVGGEVIGAFLWSTLTFWIGRKCYRIYMPDHIKNRHWTIVEILGIFFIAPALTIYAIFVFVIPLVHPRIDDNSIISGAMRDNYIQGAIQGCVNHSMLLPENAGVPAETITQYCTCIANGTADFMTYGDAKNFGSNNVAFAEKYKAKAQAVSASCMQSTGN